MRLIYGNCPGGLLKEGVMQIESHVYKTKNDKMEIIYGNENARRRHLKGSLGDMQERNKKENNVGQAEVYLLIKMKYDARDKQHDV